MSRGLRDELPLTELVEEDFFGLGGDGSAGLLVGVEKRGEVYQEVGLRVIITSKGMGKPSEVRKTLAG
jgi:hypothetical protein